MAEKTQKPTTEEKPKALLVQAHARSLRIAPRKLRLVANLVKKMRVEEALVHLRFTNKKGAPIVTKLLQSAVANAGHNFSLDPASLYIQSITCDGAQVMGRFMPRARGSASPINRRMSHLHVVLESRAMPKSRKTSRFGALLPRRKAAEAKQPEATSPISTEAAEAPKTGVAPKTNEQVKQNKIQQKRRLFNRRIGE